MRVLLSSRPSYGHTFPLFPLARALVASGHTVVFATDAPMLDEVTARGFSTRRVGPSIAWAEAETRRRYPELASLPTAEQWRFGSALYGDVLPAAVAQSLAPILLEERPDLIVFDPADFGAALAGGLRGIPVVRHAAGRGWTRPMRGGADRPPPQFAEMAKYLDALWRGLGGPQPCVDAFAGQAYIETWPEGLRDPYTEQLTTRLLMRTDTSEPALGHACEWLSRLRTRPLVYVTLGTVVFPIDAYRMVIDAFDMVGVDAIVSTGRTGDPEALGPPSDHVRIVDFVAQESILPHVNAVLHHCGSGSMLGSLAAGLPALGLPMGGDQFLNAEALRDSGSGLVLEPEHVSTTAVASALHELLTNSSFRVAAESVRDRIQSMPAPEEVVRQLEEIVGRFSADR